MATRLSETLQMLLEHAGITPTELARRTNVGQPVIHRMLSGETDNPKVGSLSPIAKHFVISISQLIGDEPLPAHCLTAAGKRKGFYWTQVPLLEWEECLTPVDHMDPNLFESMVSTDTLVSNKAFAVVVQDTTMRPRFPEGTMLVVDPACKPTDRDYALVHIDGHSKPTFKQILIDGDDVYLKPLNEDFNMIHLDRPYKFIGTVVQTRNNYREITTDIE